MNGKELKVIEYDLTFGSNARMVNVFGVFRYLKNNGLYVVYTDVNTSYPIIHYGSSHIKDHSILSMSCKNEDEEIIKEYVFKVTNDESLNDFENVSLESIDGIEIISSNRLEVKPDVINALVDKTIPKKEVASDELAKTKDSKKNNKKSFKFVFILLLIVILGGGILFVFPMFQQRNTSTKMITCNKKVNDSSLNAVLDESLILNFDYQNILTQIDKTTVFQFNTEEAYQNFIHKGIMYRYMPVDDSNGGFKQDDKGHIFTIIEKEKIGDDYQKSVNYEDVLAENKREGYQCEEKILGE